MPRSTTDGSEAIEVIPRAGPASEEAQLTEAQIAVVTERLENALRLLSNSEARMERMFREQREWQQRYEQETEKRLTSIDNRLNSQERWRAYVVGAVTVAILLFGSGAAWVALAIR